MPNNKWDEDNIENLLKDFPAIKDERPKEEVYKRLQQTNTKKKKPQRWIPYLVAALAFITFGILLASTLGQNNNDSAFLMGGSESSEESGASDSAAFDMNDAGEMAEMESADSSGAEESSEANISNNASDDITRSSIYKEELESSTLLTIGLTDNAVVIPVSFLLPDELLQADFGTNEVNSAELYNRYAAQVDEEALGFDDYHPYSGIIEMTPVGIRHTIPADHPYDMASASMSVYFNSLSAGFPDAEEILVVDESGNPADFNQIGTIQPFDPAARTIAYYLYETANGKPYLVPGYDMPHENAVEALTAMKASPNDLYLSVVPKEVDYSVSETEDTVTVEFTEAVDFDTFTPEEASHMIEGLILSADSFGKALELHNTATDSWNGFDFTGTLPVPDAINVREFK